jgi:methylated-DNA-[protein]-cysteine S-methyltransferase
VSERRLDSPLGTLVLDASGGALTRLLFADEGAQVEPPGSSSAADDTRDLAVLDATERELREYFAGLRTTFSVPLAPRGTPFQHAVWAKLREIPFGETRAYADVARGIGDANAVRAVGRANGQNPIAILVPCHRVIGKDGSMTGYAGGVHRKEKLLALEGATPRRLFA